MFWTDCPCTSPLVERDTRQARDMRVKHPGIRCGFDSSVIRHVTKKADVSGKLRRGSRRYTVLVRLKNVLRTNDKPVHVQRGNLSSVAGSVSDLT
jgi:hypothetical protein